MSDTMAKVFGAAVDADWRQRYPTRDDRVTRDAVQGTRLMTNRDDLKGLAVWDDGLGAWKPENGELEAVAAKLGPTWTFDAYYHAFFGADPEPATPNVAPPFDYGHHMCCTAESVMEAFAHRKRVLMTWNNDRAPRLVESKALEPGNRVLPLFDGEA